MGKTVATILIVAVAIVVNIIPGVGQAISATLVGAGLGAATAASVTTALITAITSLALGAIGQLIAGKPKLDAPENTRTPLKTPIPPRMSAYGECRLYGAYAYYENSTYSPGDTEVFAPYALDVFAVHDGPADAILQRYLGDDRVTIAPDHTVNTLPHGQYADDKVRWYETLGPTPNVAFADMIDKSSGRWTSAHRGDGIVTLAVVWRPVKAETFSERFPQGAAPASIAARWQKVYDPRDVAQEPDDPATWVWSANAVLHLLHYRLTREKARRVGGAVYPTGPQLLDAWNLFFAPTVDYWIDAANVCDENVALKAGGTEKRYRSCFAHRHTDAHTDVIEALTSTFDGWTCPRADGALVVYAGKYYEPTHSIGPEEIVSYSWQHGVIDEESVNELKVTYVSKDHDYGVVDATPWRDTDDMLERGQMRTQGIDFQIPSHAQARRLAKRYFSRIMAPDRGLITTNVAGRAIRGQRYINLRIKEAGAVFFDGVAEITALTRNLATGGVTFSWVSVTDALDDWNPETEEGDPAPTADRPTLVSPPAPTVTTAFLVFVQSSDGGTGARIQIEVPGPAGDDITWFARWRKVGEPVWNEQRYTDIEPGPAIILLTGMVPVNDDLEVEVAYRPGSAAISPWSFPATAVDSDTSTVAPDAAAVPVLVQWTNTLTLRVDAIPRASTYRWRFYESDNVTLRGEVVTTAPSVAYTNTLAATHGIKRAYKVRVAGINAAGTGAEGVSALLQKVAPAAPTGLAIPDDAYTASASFTPSADPNVVGYTFAFSRTSGFDPVTAGFIKTAAVSPVTYYGLSAATYFGKVAAFDAWTSNPALLNFTAEDTFVITTGGGGATGGAPAGGDGGGTGGGGGGWNNENPIREP